MLRRFLRRRLALVGLFLVLLFFVFAYIGPVFYKWQYNQLDFQAFLQPPSADHWFGTTQNGFDMLALTMRGMQKSLIIGLIGAVISTGIAAIAGAAAGYFSGWTDRAMVAVIDLLLVLPGFPDNCNPFADFQRQNLADFRPAAGGVSVDDHGACRAQHDALNEGERVRPRGSFHGCVRIGRSSCGISCRTCLPSSSSMPRSM